MINICFLFNTLEYGGIGRTASIIMNELSEAKELSVHAIIYQKPQKEELFILNPNIKKYYLFDKNTSMRSAMLRHGVVKKAYNIVKDNDIDILVACGDMFFPLGIFVKFYKRKLKVICWHHTNYLVNSDVKFQSLSRYIGARFSDCNLVLTRDALEYYNSVNNSYNVQIYNAIDPLIINRKSYNFNSKKIISVGRLSYPKNFDRLVDIASVVLKDNPTWSWDVYGDGKELDTLVNKSIQLGIADRLHFLGNVSDIYERYPEYSFLVMTSRYEGFPMVLLEGLAFGLPLVAFDVPSGPNEIIKTGINGFLCNSEYDDEMIKAINELVKSVELRNRFSEESLNIAKEFNISNIADKWLNIINFLSENKL